MQAVILAGGKGTRLAERLNGRPKPLVDVCGVPLLERQIDTLAKHGVNHVLVLVNHAADQIESFLASKAFGPRISLIDDGEPRGTAGALLACLDLLEDRFLVVYGDTLFDIDIEHMVAQHVESGASATLLLHPNDHPFDSDLVEINRIGAITAFHGYPHPDGVDLDNLVNAAFYVCQKAALAAWRHLPVPIDFAKDLFPRMVAAGHHLHGYVSYEYIKDLGTPRRLDRGECHLRSGRVERARRRNLQGAVFLDRDGTLNRLKGYIRCPQDIELLPGAGDAVRTLNEAEYRVIVVTNQPVLARGECDEAGLTAIHICLKRLLGQSGGYLDDIRYCPHHPEAGFDGEVASLKGYCECRKPGTAMIERAAVDFNVDLKRSWMIGDSTADIFAAERLGLRSILVETGEGGKDGKWPMCPTFVAADIAAAVEIIISTDGARSGVLA